MLELKGRCLCGSVTYRATAEPVATRLCWCRDCQHLAGNGTVNVLIPSAALEISGRTEHHVSAADSGNDIRRRFCGLCGSHLFANSSARPEFTVLRVGTLDDPSMVRPTVNMWAASAPNWACLDPALDKVERQPRLPAKTPPA